MSKALLREGRVLLLAPTERNRERRTGGLPLPQPIFEQRLHQFAELAPVLLDEEPARNPIVGVAPYPRRHLAVIRVAPFPRFGPPHFPRRPGPGFFSRPLHAAFA